ncbi:MAG: ParA family protein [Pseudomonadota bacterium]
MFTLTIANRKGGSGKTTTAVNLACQLSINYPDKRILIIDLDTQNHVKLGLGNSKNKTSLGIHSIFSHTQYTISGLIQPTQWKNLSYIEADEEALEINTGNGFHRLKYFLANENIKQNFDLVILDTPPSHGAFLINAIIASDAILITFVPQTLDKTGVNKIMKLIKRHANKKIKLALLPTMTKSRIRHHNFTLASLVKNYGTSFLLKGIRAGIQLAEAFESGLPIQYYAPKSRGAYDYHMLLNELRLMWPEILQDVTVNNSQFSKAVTKTSTLSKSANKNTFNQFSKSPTYQYSQTKH